MGHEFFQLLAIHLVRFFLKKPIVVLGIYIEIGIYCHIRYEELLLLKTK